MSALCNLCLCTGEEKKRSEATRARPCTDSYHRIDPATSNVARAMLIFQFCGNIGIMTKYKTSELLICSQLDL